MITRS